MGYSIGHSVDKVYKSSVWILCSGRKGRVVKFRNLDTDREIGCIWSLNVILSLGE